MNKKFILGISLAVIAFSTVIAFQTAEINALRAENEQVKLEYSYAMEMLDGFIYNSDDAQEQLKEIKQIQKEPTGSI